MARPEKRENGVVNDRNKLWRVTDHVWLVNDRIELLEDGDGCGAEREVRRRHLSRADERVEVVSVRI